MKVSMYMSEPDPDPDPDPEPIDPETYIFTFGKYKGETYRDIREIDPRYILWADENVKWFCVPDGEIDEIFNDKMESERDRFDDMSELGIFG
jgi:broad specificity phosphatase PhoE